MAYLVLARKYRQRHLRRGGGTGGDRPHVDGRPGDRPHRPAYLFTGTRGVGKTTMARILAKALNCLSATDHAQALRTLRRLPGHRPRDDLDVVEIDGRATEVGRTQQIIASVGCTRRGADRIIYIDEVHMLTRSPSTPS